VTRTLAAALIACALAAGLRAQGSDPAETFDAAWTVVRDSHFDKAMNGVNWDAVRSELRPRAQAARSAGELRTVIRDMLSRLGQSHFALIPHGADSPSAPLGDLSAQPGFDVRLIGKHLIVTRVDRGSGAERAGVRAGWQLEMIDGVSVEPLLTSLSEAASERLRPLEAWRVATQRLRGPTASTLRLSFTDHAGSRAEVSIERQAEGGQPVRVGNLPTMFVRVQSETRQTPRGGTAGVITFNVWMAAVDALFQKAVDEFRTADGMVIDLRGNPGGLAAMIMGIAGHFLDERKPLGVMKTRDSELTFFANPRRVTAAGERVQPYAGPLAILVDSTTGSASECFAGGMQSLGRARVFGQVSMGQALPAQFMRLPNGDVLIYAFGDFVTSDGTRLEGRGVIPDEVVPLSRDALLAGRDPTLDAALAWIDSRKGVSRPESQ
jgi:carboxyl-terminal processing protease